MLQQQSLFHAFTTAELFFIKNPQHSSCRKKKVSFNFSRRTTVITHNLELFFQISSKQNFLCIRTILLLFKKWLQTVKCKKFFLASCIFMQLLRISLTSKRFLQLLPSLKIIKALDEPTITNSYDTIYIYSGSLKKGY